MSPTSSSGSIASAAARRWLFVAPIRSTPRTSTPSAPGIDHLCFRARRREDVNALHAFLLEIGADIVRAPVEGPWAPGYYSLSFRDPEGIRLELNHVPGKGLFTAGATFAPDPEYPLSGQSPPEA